jgi:beclin 1
VRLFWYRRFDNGMVAFLECVQELANHVQLRDKNFRLPYKCVLTRARGPD